MQHLACIMDGNRRWARKHGSSRIGKDGIDAAYRVVQWCIQKKIPYLSLFAFSLENFKRSPIEFEPLFTLMVEEMALLILTPQLKKENIQVRFIGDRTQFPQTVHDACLQLEETTCAGSKIVVQIFFCYGSCQEIVDTCKRIATAAVAGTIPISAITNHLFRNNICGLQTHRILNLLSVRVAFTA